MSENTKKALANSLKDLLVKKPFNKIIVEDITQNCGVSRMTFYYYFSDIYDLVKWICEEDAKALLEKSVNDGNWSDGLLKIFNNLLENKTFIMNLYFNIDRLELEKFLYSITYNLMLRAVDEIAKESGIKVEDKRFIAHFYKFAYVGVVLDWVHDYMKEDPIEIISRLNIILKSSIRANISSIVSEYEER